MIKLKPLIENKKRYSAVLLDDASRNALLAAYRDKIPKGWEEIAHHQTIDPFGLVDAAQEGTPVTLKVTEFGIDDKACAVKVSGYNGKTNNAYPHVTLAINRAGGGKPKDSNTIKSWTKVENGATLHGTVENL